MDEDPDEFIPTRQSLLSRPKNWDDAASWREFFNTCWKLIQMFDSFVLKKWSAAKVARTLGASIGHVYVAGRIPSGPPPVPGSVLTFSAVKEGEVAEKGAGLTPARGPDGMRTRWPSTGLRG